MNSKSIRFQLTLWYAAALFFCLTIVLGLFYLLTKQALFSQTDQTLIAHGLPIVDLVNTPECCLTQEQSSANRVLLNAVSSMPGMVVILLSSSGELLSSSLDMVTGEVMLSDLFQIHKNSPEPVLLNELIHGTQIRLWVVPVVRDGNFQGMVMIGHPIDNIQKSLKNLSFTLALVFAALIIPTLLGGYLLAQRVMMPLKQFSQELSQITSTNLDKRLKNPLTSDELELLGRTFNQLLDRISTAFTRERQLIGDLAHELKTPLTILRSNAEVALSKPRSGQEYQQSLGEVMIDADRIETTLQSILDLAWSRADVADFTAQKCDVSEVLADLKKIVLRLAVEKRITVQFKLIPEVMVLGKSDKLSRAILNVIENAIKYTPQLGKVTVTLKTIKKSAVIVIRDDGMGVATEDLPHIFDRFYRGATTMDTHGTGLGLAITQAIVEAHNGRIRVKSNLNVGTVVSIWLPLVL